MKRIQNSIATSLFREADALKLARRFMTRKDDLKILSFGCSIGDELATLRTIFPSAQIYGCEIDSFALERAKRSVGHFATIFLSSDDEIRKRGPFDLICAFSSLCLNPTPPLDVIEREFPFSLFEEMIQTLSSSLNVGGMLCLKNTIYPFTRTSLSTMYNRVRSDSIFQNGFVSMMNPSGAVALSVYMSSYGPIHRIEDVSGLDDWDFIDCVFEKRSELAVLPEIKWHRSEWSRPDLQFEEIARWTRSNLDAISNTEPVADGLDRLIDMTQTHRTFLSPQRPEVVLIERDTYRKSVKSGEMMLMNTTGWWS